MANLASVLGSLCEDNGTYFTDAPEDWAQGRALFGGIVAALCAQTARLSVPGLPPLRSAQVTFAGPAQGRLGFRADLLRRGKSTTVIGVDCASEGRFAARVTLTYGVARESRIEHDLTERPSVPEPLDCKPFFPAGHTPPGFFPNFEMRIADGARPLSGAEKPEFSVWVRHVEEDGVDPTIALVALADSLPPAAMVHFPMMAPISTMSWGIDFRQPLTLRGWHLLRSTSEQAADGYSLQSMSVWDAQGKRIAAGRQAVALFI
jgi:acyl-CoA thioesterase